MQFLAEQNSGLFSETLWYVVRRADDFRTREAHRQRSKMAQLKPGDPSVVAALSPKSTTGGRGPLLKR